MGRHRGRDRGRIPQDVAEARRCRAERSSDSTGQAIPAGEARGRTGVLRRRLIENLKPKSCRVARWSSFLPRGRSGRRWNVAADVDRHRVAGSAWWLPGGSLQQFPLPCRPRSRWPTRRLPCSGPPPPVRPAARRSSATTSAVLGSPSRQVAINQRQKNTPDQRSVVGSGQRTVDAVTSGCSDPGRVSDNDYA
jgi:hypothetical protein